MFFTIWKSFLEKRVFSFFLLILIILAGIFSLFSLPKESSPEVQIPVAVIGVPFFGASASEVESQITEEIENSIKNISGISEINSTSSVGFSSVVVNFKQGENVLEKIDELEEKIDGIKNSLPINGSEISINDVNLSDQPVFSFSVFSNQNDFAFLKTADLIQDEIKKIDGVSNIYYNGLSQIQYSIILDQRKIKQYGLSLEQIKQKISASNIVIPAGDIEIKKQTYSLDIDSKIKNISDLENIVLKNIKNNTLFLKDVAKIEKKFEEKKVISQIFLEGNFSIQKNITFYVSKERGFNILKLTDNLKKELEILKEKEKINYEVVLDLGEYAKKDITELSKNGIATTILVFLILIFILKTKDAFIAAIGIPITFLVAFIFFLIVGNTINFISLFSMIIAIGILVDSDIVITEGIAKRKQQVKEKNPEMPENLQEKKASILAVKDLAGPMIAGTATTIVVFAPLLFLSGVTGEFIKNIPFTIIFILLASQIVSVFFIPLLHSIKFFKNKKGKKMKKINFSKYENIYKNILEKFIGNKKKENIFVFSIIFLFFISFIFPISGLVKSEFFPKGDVDYIFVNVELERDASLLDTQKYLKDLTNQIKDKKYYKSIITTAGKKSSFGRAQGENQRLGNILINLKDEEKENGSGHLASLRKELKEKGFDKAEISAPEGGPPTGAPIDFRVLGDSFEDVKNSTIIAENILESYADVLNIESELEKSNLGFDIVIDHSKASLYSINISALSSKILAHTKGVEVLEIKEKEKSVKAFLTIENLQDKKQNQINPDDIKNLQIKNQKGEYIYLSSFAEIFPKNKNSVLKKFDSKNSVRVQAEKKEDANTQEIIKRFQKDFERKNFYKTYLSFGGSFKAQQESFAETGIAFLIGIASIFGILIFLFNSIRLSFIIESVIPLIFTGIVFGLFLTANAISFPALLGFIALSGIVVNNSIILIYVYEEKRKNILKTKQNLEKADIEKIVIEGSIERFRAIMLTTITTIVGVTPLIFASAIWAPISYTIIFGLSYATLITLIFIPIIYKKFYPKK